jgi:hypothetical protein
MFFFCFLDPQSDVPEEVKMFEALKQISENEKTDLKCRFCNTTFAERRERVNHEKICDKFYVLPKKPSVQSLASSTLDSEDSNTVKCKFCHKKFGLKKNCNRHEKSCKVNPASASPVFTCELCGSTHNRKDNFNSHYKKCQERHNNQLNSENQGTPPQPSDQYKTSRNMKQAKARENKHTPCPLPGCVHEYYHKGDLIDHLCKVSTKKLM